MIKTIIIEDELQARNGLSFLLKERDQIEVIGIAEDGLRAIEMINTLEPDLILLDIQMPIINGFEVLSSVEFTPPFIIFITAYEEYAIKAFEENALDYLLKPFTNNRFFGALDKAIELIKIKKSAQLNLQKMVADKADDIIKDEQSLAQNKFVFRCDGRIIILDFEEIIMIEAYDYYINIITEKKKYTIRLSMGKAVDILPSKHFIRIHRSTIVNISKIKFLDVKDKFIGLENSTQKDIGPSYYQKLLNIFPTLN